jgi:hypothetical protein
MPSDKICALVNEKGLYIHEEVRAMANIENLRDVKGMLKRRQR